jgi:hypothetical protein
MRKAPIISGLKNSGEAYRHFRPSGFLSDSFLSGAHEALVDLLNHRLVGAAIALMGSAGIIGTFILFWPN